MATTPNSAIRPQTARRISAVITGANSTYSGGAGAISNAVKLCDVGPNGLSWLVKLASTPRALIAAYNIQLFWSADAAGTVLNYITSFAGAAVTAMPSKETDFGLTDTAYRTLAPTAASFWVASDTGLAAGIVVNGEIQDA